MTTALLPTLLLDSDGVFVATSERGVFRLSLVDEGELGQWRVTGPVGSNVDAPFVGASMTLDFALSLMARVAFGAAEFKVALPCGETFSRSPRARVPAEEILAAYEYQVALEMAGHAMLMAPAAIGEAEVREHIELQAKAAGMSVIAVELIESDDSLAHWCVELRYPFSGPVKTQTALAVVREAILEAGLEPAADYVEFTVPRAVVANSAKIAQLRNYRSAA